VLDVQRADTPWPLARDGIRCPNGSLRLGKGGKRFVYPKVRGVGQHDRIVTRSHRGTLAVPPAETLLRPSWNLLRPAGAVLAPITAGGVPVRLP
jgi:hypothetical protein